MSVRPFYIKAHADGRKTPIEGGTRRKDGTHSISIHQRDNGEITTPFRIEQSSYTEDGVLKLVTNVYYQGELIKSHITDY